MRQPVALPRHFSIRAGLCLINTAEPAHRLPEETAQMQQISDGVEAELTLGGPQIERLFALWNGLLQLGADEVGDWALDVPVTLASDHELPPVIAVGAAVYASGEVAFSVSFLGFDAPMWLDDQFELNSIAKD